MAKDPVKYDPAIHHRCSIRLKGHNYAGGGEYFVTICAHREFIAAHGRRPFDPFRKIIEKEWQKCGEIRDDVFPCEMAIMPDHFHGLLRIAPGQSELGKVVGAFKAAVSRKIRMHRIEGNLRIARTGDSKIAPQIAPQIAPDSKIRIWHRNYYERIIRGAQDRERTAKYIRMNPVKLQFRIDGMPAMGNPSLWDLPTIGILASGTGDSQIALSSAAPAPENTTLLSGCHSGMEEQLVRESELPLIWMPAVSPDSVGFSDWQIKRLEAGTLLVICPFDETHTTRENALKRNHIIAERCEQLWGPTARKGGSLEKLKQKFRGKLT